MFLSLYLQAFRINGVQTMIAKIKLTVKPLVLGLQGFRFVFASFQNQCCVNDDCKNKVDSKAPGFRAAGF